MSDHYILGGKDGHQAIKVSCDAWAQWYEGRITEDDRRNIDHRRVAQDTVREPNRLLWALGLRPDYWVSTVFLGLDHSFNGKPQIFETMVFRRWPGWKRWLSNRKRPMKMGESWAKSWDRWPYPPMSGWVFEFEWLGIYRLWRIPNPVALIKRYYRRNYMFIHIFDWSEFSEQDMDRYATWDEAVKGHNEILAKWRKAVEAGNKASPSWGGEGGDG